MGGQFREGRKALPPLLAVAHAGLQRQFLADPRGLVFRGDAPGAVAHQAVAGDQGRQGHQDEQEFVDRRRVQQAVRHEEGRGHDGHPHQRPERPGEEGLCKGGRRGFGHGRRGSRGSGRYEQGFRIGAVGFTRRR